MDIDREAWLKEAEAAERAGSVLTCQAFVKNTIGIGVNDEDRKRTWVADAEECKKCGSFETARAIYAHTLTMFLTKNSIWLKAAQLEKSHGTRGSLDALLKKAVNYNPRAEVLWLMAAKEKWLAEDFPAARAILQEAYAAIPSSEEIWLAAFKLEFENNEPESKNAFGQGQGPGKEEAPRGGRSEAFPFILQVVVNAWTDEDQIGHGVKAKEVYENGLKHRSSCIPLWLSLSRLEEKISGLSKSRAVLTMARKKNPATPKLWLAAIRAELRHGNKREANALLAKALQECPTSGILWATSIEMVPRPKRKGKSLDAIKRCDHDRHVLATVAKLFWHDRKVDKARNWLNRAVTFALDIGDFWGLYYKFEIQHGNAMRCSRTRTW
ncbi:protein STABILIZED1 [Panicum miliaceum]|uniref:Protein STABILIZED1 n=1 Tax=Panicum miliaceum TaxID=4540 RepID=A0A3L6SWT0_PANMI|nr:protein STABILIZED1 [Panicum miliaceum]